MDMTVNQLLRPGERIDDLQRENRSNLQQCGLRIIQDPSRFCFGMDAVLLAAYVQMKKARRGLDLGTGNGIIPILLSDRTDCAHLTGLEIQPASADLAKRSVALNGLQDRISIVQGDIREADRIFAPASFDLITCNPPYRAVGSGRITGSIRKNLMTAPPVLHQCGSHPLRKVGKGLRPDRERRQRRQQDQRHKHPAVRFFFLQ